MQNQRGFIALISVVIISAILLVLVFTLETSSFFARFDALDHEDKRVSLGLAEACVNKAMLKIAQSDNSAEKVSVGADTCNICSINLGTGEIFTQASYHGAYTNLDVTVDPNSGSFTVGGWKETPTYTGGSCAL